MIEIKCNYKYLLFTFILELISKSGATASLWSWSSIFQGLLLLSAFYWIWLLVKAVWLSDVCGYYRRFFFWIWAIIIWLNISTLIYYFLLNYWIFNLSHRCTNIWILSWNNSYHWSLILNTCKFLVLILKSTGIAAKTVTFIS